MKIVKRHYSYMDNAYELHHFHLKRDAVSSHSKYCKSVSGDKPKPILWVSEYSGKGPVVSRVCY